MNQERKDRIKALRRRFSNLTDAEKQRLASRGLIATVEGRTLSLHNTLLLYIQGNGNRPTVVAGYRQWLKAGRQVQKGQQGMVIFYPVGQKDRDTGDIADARAFYSATVFDIGQTELTGSVQEKPAARPEPRPEPQPADIMKDWSLV